jgi:carbonic anhydrase
MEFRILLLSIIILFLTDKIICVAWDYDKVGPDVWSKYYPDCGKHSQSPVNIQTACTIHQDFQPFQFTSIYNDTLNFTLKNDGHTITVRHNGHILPLTGGNLNGNYQFSNFHVHWGPNEKVGSEHQM